MRVFTLIFVLFAVGGAQAALPQQDPFQSGPYSQAQHDLSITASTGVAYPLTVHYPGSGAQLDISGGPYPVAILNHGFQLTKENMANYGRLLATWGYVAIAPTRPRIQFDNEILIQELQSVLDWLEAQNADGSSRYHQAIDMQRVAAVGHSAGGKLSFGLALRDGRIDTVVGLDPVDSGFSPQMIPDNMGLLSLPFLVLGSDVANDPCAPPAQNFTQFYEAGNPPKVEVTIIGANHCAMLEGADVFCFVCGQGSDTSRQEELSLRLTVAWLNVHLSGETWFERYITGPEAQSEVQAGAIALRSDLSAALPTPTSPPAATATPTPSPTATAQPTATPAQGRTALAGYLGSDLATGRRSEVRFLALVEDVTGPLIVTIGGVETDLLAEPDGDGAFGYALPLEAAAPASALLGLSDGSGETLWPYLAVQP